MPGHLPSVLSALERTVPKQKISCETTRSIIDGTLGGVVHIDFDQIRPTSEVPGSAVTLTTAADITRNERFRPSTMSGYPGIYLTLRSRGERVRQSCSVE